MATTKPAFTRLRARSAWVQGAPPEPCEMMTVGLRMLRRGQAVLDAEVAAQLVEVVLAGGGPFAQTEETVGELAAIVRENGADLHRAGPFEIAQEPAGIGGSLGFADADEDPSGRPINGHEQVAS